MSPALIFDCDGVLADTERDGHRVAFNRAFEAMSERYSRLTRTLVTRPKRVMVTYAGLIAALKAAADRATRSNAPG